MDRRKFITKTGQSLALLNVAGLASASPIKTANHSDIAPENIIYRTLGRTGLKVTVVSMGVMNASIPGLIVRSYDKGVRLFDTAWYYQNGMNEKMLGEALDKNQLRNDVNIVTKIYLKETERDLYQPEIKQLFIERFEESLHRLKTDYRYFLASQYYIKIRALKVTPESTKAMTQISNQLAEQLNNKTTFPNEFRHFPLKGKMVLYGLEWVSPRITLWPWLVSHKTRLYMTFKNRFLFERSEFKRFQSFNRSFMSLSRLSQRFFCLRFFIFEKMKSGFGVENPRMILRVLPTKYHIEPEKLNSVRNILTKIF
ncbi:aldo/keto reductase [Carboxylicivirga marina]|uniref:Aldo/keto reductase n=1 Tax=Carboxylicivirga marina TaxID=2800988 RepID=A0ABS1HIV5_9BACT|nr:aldo/keto reductase [Carboxylicivirga marina]MBK3517613.1 aldo/keto reductase [Carboxylicivirga marina]